MELRSSKKSGLFLYLRERFGLDLQWQNHKLHHLMQPILNVQLQGRCIMCAASLCTSGHNSKILLGQCTMKLGLYVLGDAYAHQSVHRILFSCTWCAFALCIRSILEVGPYADARCAGENCPPYISTNVGFIFHCVKTMNFIVVFTSFFMKF